MPCYALVAALGSLLASGRHAGWFSQLGVWAAYGVFVGMLFDVLENVGQAVQLLNGTGTALQTIAVGICASFKFSLPLLCILYGLVGWTLPKKDR